MAILFSQEDRSRIQNAWLSNALCFVWYFSRTVDTPFQRGYYLQRRAKCPIYIWWGSYMVHVFNITCLLTVQFYVEFIIIFSLFGVTLIFEECSKVSFISERYQQQTPMLFTWLIIRRMLWYENRFNYLHMTILY